MLTLSPLAEEHLEYRVKLLNDIEIKKYLNTNEIFTIEKTIKWFLKRNLEQRFDCVFLDDSIVIGMGGLSNISHDNRNAELYMYLDTRYQGMGYGTRFLIELCKFGFDKLRLNKIYLYTFSDNLRANSLYEKIGFIREGHLREQTLKGGILQDRYFYGLLAREFIVNF